MDTQFNDQLNFNQPDETKEYTCSKYVTSKQFTVLMKCVMVAKSHPNLLETYIAQYYEDVKKQVNEQNEKGWTALMLACRNSNTVSTYKSVQVLLNLGANVNMMPNYGWTALMLACRYSGTDSTVSVVKLLLRNGADINLQTHDGYTALMMACRYSNTDSTVSTVELLLHNGANVNLQNNVKWTALMSACRYSNTESTLSTVELLLNNGANINLQNNDGWTALMFACGNTDSTESMLACGNTDSTESMLACGNTDSTEATVELLLNNGADVNLQTNRGNTVLNLACMKSCDNACIPVIELLLKYKHNDIDAVLEKVTKQKYNFNNIDDYYRLACLLISSGARLTSNNELTNILKYIIEQYDNLILIKNLIKEEFAPSYIAVSHL